LLAEAVSRGINLRLIDADTVGVSLDEATNAADLDSLLKIFGKARRPSDGAIACGDARGMAGHLRRAGATLTHPSSIRTAPRRKCCATSASSNRAIFPSAPR